MGAVNVFVNNNGVDNDHAVGMFMLDAQLVEHEGNIVPVLLMDAAEARKVATALFDIASKAELLTAEEEADA